MPNPKFRVSLRLANITYLKIAPTIVEALEKMEPQHLSKAKGVITVSRSGLKASAMLFPLQLKQLFINKTAKEIFQKRMLGALK